MSSITMVSSYPVSSVVQAAPAAEETKEETKVEEAPKPKSPSLLAKILAPFKDKKVKAPKRPKKEKKKEEVETPAAEPVKETCVSVVTC